MRHLQNGEWVLCKLLIINVIKCLTFLYALIFFGRNQSLKHMSNKIKQVSAFQTSDGQMHETRLEALTHQFELDLLAEFKGATSVPQFSEKTAAYIVAKNLGRFADIIRSYKPRIDAAQRLAEAKAS